MSDAYDPMDDFGKGYDLALATIHADLRDVPANKMRLKSKYKRLLRAGLWRRASIVRKAMREVNV